MKLLLASLISLASVSAVDWQNVPGGRMAAAQIAPGGKVGFTQMTPAQTGVTFSNLLSVQRYTTNQIHLNGSGVAAGDVDGDGQCDLYFCGLDNNNALFKNLGNWKFEDIAKSAGVACEGRDSTGAAFADIDGDRDLDLIVNSVASGTDVFLNNGKGQFAKSTTLNPGRGGMSLALADIDGDGDLDLYIVNYRTTTVRDQPNTRIQGETINGKMVVQKVNGRSVTEPDLANRFELDPSGKMTENGEADVLFRNDGSGRFSPISFTNGDFIDEAGKPLREPPFDWGLSAMLRDMNGDGAPDIYVCNDFHSPDRMWINDGKGRFRAAPALALRHTSMFSMGVDFADVNRDGHDDFFVADMLSRSHRRRHTQTANYAPLFTPIGRFEEPVQYSFNNLQLNRGDGTYAEIAHFTGLEASDWSWTPIFLDVDLDGFEDLLVTTGHERDALHMDYINEIETKKARERLSGFDVLNLQKIIPKLATPNAAFRNRGDLTFEETTSAWGFDAPGVSHGMAVADLDNDGDLDVAMNNLNGNAGLFRNDAPAPRVAVRLKGAAPNTHGIGAKIKVTGGAMPQSQEMISGGRYLSSDDATRTFSAAGASNITIEVTWRGGKRTTLPNAKANAIYEVDESAAQSFTKAPDVVATQLFEDVSHLLKHIHHEDLYDDFLRQPLLPHRFSQLGPGVCWHDFDADGFEDLIVGAGRGGAIAAYRNDRRGGFGLLNEAPFNRAVNRDQTTILAWDAIVMAGSANYEDGLTNGGAIRIYDTQRKATGESIIGEPFSRGPLAMADVDNDGDLDVFIGGRVSPARYPEPVSSLLLKNDNGRFAPFQRFDKLGLVSGAVFSDLTGDGKPELILACEWGPVRVLQNADGQFVDVTQKLGLGDYLGWWNGVATGDFDNDGRLDIVASNWGLNTKYRASRERPRRLYYGDINGAGALDLVESYFDPELKKEVPERILKVASTAFPFLQGTFPTSETYSVASIQEIYGDKLKSCAKVEANTLASMVFFNRGDRFEARQLPSEAQFAPAFGISVADADGDGAEDIFLSQNFFAVAGETPRNDAGRGLWLRGDGQGKFSAMSTRETGISIYGEQRGCAVADYDADGRIDLVVAQNGAATKLFHNRGARAGLRVRLRGDAGNTASVGAAMRLIFANQKGPLREIHSGSGYWSQESPVQILATPRRPTAIWIRWPGGKETLIDVPEGAAEIEVQQNGALRVSRKL